MLAAPDNCPALESNQVNTSVLTMWLAVVNVSGAGEYKGGGNCAAVFSAATAIRKKATPCQQQRSSRLLELRPVTIDQCEITGKPP